ncbi:phage terminase large subunit family protein [Neorhizobium sp. T7_12]|uniref:phage terminase large subunit family protein n=1 Tax=Neorhizobium sp. T7_12 TaxID=2093832 RepID=UPI001FE1237E|nr:terminase gpA endonuclease subunit [Neorhizobium sp. T7_12]
MEKEIRLPSTVSGVPGKIKLYAPQKGIADAIGDPAYRQVSVLKSARIGYTTVLTGAVANFVVNDPSLMLVYLPNDDMAKSFVTSDLEPTFADSPVLQGVLSGDKSSGGKDRSTMLMRQFTGGTLKILSAETPRSFRAHNARVVIMDEVDGMKPTTEGHPIPLAKRRTAQFADYKLIVGSTPDEEETSYVSGEYAKSDQRVFQVRCVECDDYSEVLWADIHWPEGQPEKAAWHCPKCGCEVEHKHKSTMVQRGRWRVTKPEVKGHAGFKINSLTSPLPNADWGLLAEEFLLAKNDPLLLKPFVNTILGEAWRTGGDRIDEFALMDSAEPFGLGGPEQQPFPEDVLAVTVGIDMQDDRGEVTYLGHTGAGELVVLDHDIVHGSYEHDEFWTDIDAIVKQRWRHPLGGEIGIDAVAIDSSNGNHMPHVYAFVKPRLRRKIVAIKGDGGRRPFILRSKTMKKDPLWIVGVDSIKDTILNRIQHGKIFRFSRDLPEVWYEQFTGEQAVVKMDRGRPVRKWIPVPGRRNEALDCVVYAIAAKELVTINWTQRREQLSTGHTVSAANDNTPQAKPRKAKSYWL